MKRFLCAMMALALVLSCFTAFAVAEGETVVSMAVSGSVSEQALRFETAKLYEEQHPGTKIEWIDLGDDRVTKTMTLVSSGAAPDILYLNENIYTYTTKGVLAPLTPFIEAEDEGYLDYFYESLLAPLTLNGELYALPQEVSPYVIFYNKDLLTKYGMEIPTDDWTFDQWYEAIKTAADKGRADLVYGQNLMSWADHYLQLFSRLGVEIYEPGAKELWVAKEENREKTLAAFEWLRKAILDDKVCPNPAEVTAMGQGFNQMFRNQQVVFQTTGLWVLPDFKDEPLAFEWDVVKAPLSQDGTFTTRAGILNWGIYSGSNNKEAAWDVLKFFVGHEGQKIVAKYNMALPGAKDDEANQMIRDSKFPANVETFEKSVDGIEQGDSYSLCEDEINNALTAELQSMVLGEQSPEEALDNFLAMAVDTLQEAVEANE